MSLSKRNDLVHPFLFGLLNDPGDLDPPSFEIDDEEHEMSDQARLRDHFDAEEVRCRYRSPVSLQERFPRHSPLPGGIKPVLEKDPFDRNPTELMAQVVERSSDSGVTPARVLLGHPNDKLPDLDHSLGTARSSSLAAIVLPGDQLSMPLKERGWRHQGFEFEKPFPTDRSGLDREATTLLIGESQSLEIGAATRSWSQS
jgi:hypothetical protein